MQPMSDAEFRKYVGIGRWLYRDGVLGDRLEQHLHDGWFVCNYGVYWNYST